MTPQERQLVDDLFDRLSKVEGAPRDPDALDAIAQGQRRAPNALYALVQTVLLQDEALKRAHDRIQQLEAGGTPEQPPQGGFLDTMRDALFGQGQGANAPRGSVPSVRPAEPNRAAWNTGQVLGQPQQGGYAQAPAPGGYGQQPYAQPQAGGGGSFLGTAAAAAAGMVGGSLLLGSIRSMMGGNHQQGFGDASAFGSGGSSPWSTGGGSLGRDAGLNDIGSNNNDAYKAGAYDQAQADADQDQDQDQDDGDYDTADSDSGSGSDDSDWT
jgi:hypothetical protein